MIFGLIGLFICVCIIIYCQGKLEEERVENEILSLKNEEKTRLEKEIKELEQDAEEIQDLSVFIEKNKNEITKAAIKIAQEGARYKKHKLSIGDSIKLEENI